MKRIRNNLAFCAVLDTSREVNSRAELMARLLLVFHVAQEEE